MRLPRSTLFLGFLALSQGLPGKSAFGPGGWIVSSHNQYLKAQLGGMLELDAYKGAQENPGFIYTEQDTFVVPRLSLQLDAQAGPNLYAFMLARADRGFDPGNGYSRYRLDEYSLRLRTDSGSLSLEAGKFATIIGNWVARHDAWHNPLIGAPLPYELYTAQVHGRTSSGGTFSYWYDPVLWGPVYAEGIAVRARAGNFDLAVELKNSSPSADTEYWSRSKGFEHPATALRLGFRPDMRLQLGFSLSDSVFLPSSSAGSVPAGRHLGEYRERFLAQDLSYQWGHLQIWAELFEARVQTPLLGTGTTRAGYIETRYKVAPGVALSLRVNRQVFPALDRPNSRITWGPNLSRIDCGAAWNIGDRALLKLQVGTLRRDSRYSTTYAFQSLLRF